MAQQYDPNLTDRRYEGYITSFLQDKGFGFIRCAELRPKFQEKDVFVHGKQMGNFKEGDTVSFAIFFNKDGKPQATELQMGSGGAAQMSGGSGMGGGGVNLPPPPPPGEDRGAADRRYEGYITSFRQDKGFGFIRCAELRSKYPDKDIFVHGKQMGNFKEGDTVSFAIFFNKDGKPQATELQMGGGGAPQMGGGMGMGGGGGMGQQMQMQQQAPPPPVVSPPVPVEELGVQEVEVPQEFVTKLTAKGGNFLDDLKAKAGGQTPITLTFQTRAERPGMAIVVVKGSKAAASLGAILVMQALTELIEIPI